MLLLSCLRLQGQACNDLSYISLDPDCAVEVTPDMVLEGTPVDTSYVVSLATQAGVPIPNLLTAAHIGSTIQATVTDTLTGNSCWGLLIVEDKLPPEIACENIEIPCAAAQYAPDYLANMLGIAAAFPSVFENCSAYTLTYIDSWLDLACNDPQDRSAQLQRVWTATDASGNQATCTQFIYFQRVHVDAVLFPADTTLDCSNPLLGPLYTGQPYVEAYGVQFPLYIGDLACELDITYVDQEIPLCGTSYSVLRTWTVYDDCLPTVPLLNPRTYIQVIFVKDLAGPTFDCPKDTLVSTDPFTCNKSLDLPDVIISDNCSNIAEILAVWTVNGVTQSLAGTLTNFPGNNLWNADTLGVLGYANNLPAGVTTIKYIVTDACGNSSTCTFKVTVSDGVKPWVACDEFTQVSLGNTGVALINASTFDDGSGDYCAPIFFKARRVETNACQPTDRFYDQVRFCCSDVGDTITVILRVYDLPPDTGAVSLTLLEDHASDCIVQVFVDDKLKPVCLAPLNQTIACELFDPHLENFGVPAFADNCCLDTFFEMPPNLSAFDTLCNRGTITRIFRAQDCNGLTSQCTQRIIIGYKQDFAVKFPDDVFVNDCDTTDVYSPGPEIFGEDCETIAASYQDNVSTGGVLSCYWIERRWIVVDWCSYNPNLPLIEVPNPNPAVDPLDPQNKPGPVVAPQGHVPAPTHMRVTPNDPEPTDYSIFWKANANGYLYRQIISVRDDVPPKIRGCPATLPVEFCDHSDNDPMFWNATYWPNPSVPGSYDLCEGPTSLAVTASDGCSKGNVNIRYLLFLDLDGDGVQETVINSLNPPPPNVVYFGNALNPNFTGGEPRAFDNRPVAPDEKYRFAIERTGYVNVTGYVRWSTIKDPNTYVMPQLPYGNHRIQWIIDDGCGNETICAYPILVRDCHVPDLLCINGLSVDIPQTESITLYTNDFLWYANDNCTPADQLVYGLRKSGTGHAFPANPDGTPQQSVTFTCDELGTQYVELWVRDMAGNFSICETYAIIQDNFGICSSTMASVAGSVQTENSDGLEDVHINLEGTHPAQPPVSMFDVSDPNGLYGFPNALPFGTDMTITPSKENDPLNGVSTFDLVLINKHILGQAPLSSPYQFIAADINRSKSVTTFDVVELRKLILGIYTGFPQNTSWRFVDANYQFPNPSNPFQEPFPEKIVVPSMNTHMLSEDFVAVKIGDINGNAVTNSLQSSTPRTSGTLYFDGVFPTDVLLEPGEEFTVTLAAAEAVLGCQLTLRFPDLDILRVDPGENMSAEHFGVFSNDHALTMSWDGNGKPSFALTFKVRKAGRIGQLLNLSSQITRTEAYLPNQPEPAAIALRFGDLIEEQDFEMYLPRPNPWQSKTTLGFYLPGTSRAVLTVTDQTGKQIWQEAARYDKGYHSINLDANRIPATGVFFLQLETVFGLETGKMIRL